MSARNGDRARFHKNRVRKLLKRQRLRVLLGRGAEPQQAKETAKTSKA
jgi:hypothetical protein